MYFCTPMIKSGLHSAIMEVLKGYSLGEHEWDADIFFCTDLGYGSVYNMLSPSSPSM